MLHEFKNLTCYLTYSEPEGGYVGPIIASPLSIHFARFDIYRDWTVPKILVYEAFITYSQMYGNPFFKTQEKMLEDLRLGKYTLRKELNSLIDAGYIEKRKGGESENFKNFYTVKFDNIIRDVNQIYRFEVLNDNAKEGVRELYIYKFETYKNRAIHHEGRFPIIFRTEEPDEFYP